jgi:HK97 family phage prohead protease
MTTTLQQRRADAAAKRSHEVRALADRPSRRRCAESPTSTARVSARITQMRVSDVAEDGTVEFDGYASITGEAYEMWDWYGPYDEIVDAGAFAVTLAQVDLDVPFVIGHDQIRRIARTLTADLTLTEDGNGLHVKSTLRMSDPDVAYIVPKLRAGHIDEMSFAFRIVRGQWSPDYTQYNIQQVDLHRGDVAIVGYGANPFTAGSGLAGDSDDAETDDERAAPATPTTKRGVDLITEDDIAPRRAMAH